MQPEILSFQQNGLPFTPQQSRHLVATRMGQNPSQSKTKIFKCNQRSCPFNKMDYHLLPNRVAILLVFENYNLIIKTIDKQKCGHNGKTQLKQGMSLRKNGTITRNLAKWHNNKLHIVGNTYKYNNLYQRTCWCLKTLQGFQLSQ